MSPTLKEIMCSLIFFRFKKKNILGHKPVSAILKNTKILTIRKVIKVN